MIAITAPARWVRPTALVVFVALPCLLAALTVANILRWAEARTAQAEQAERVADIERRVRSLTADRPPALDMSRIYLGATVATLARAELQTRVVDLIERSGSRLIEVRADEDAPAEDPLSATVRATFETVQDRLVDLLAAVEGGLPLLRVAGLDARLEQRRESSVLPDDPRLRITLTVRSYRKRGQP
ncbi:type II secretion system protein GspM [Methylobacterium sp. HMF5984]|uniref:type II secretion system protein GspM n=1 Tax=Methylobacterium sp. HMF5984 TaxID=3367370 RepID=UPI00385422CD